MRSQTGSSWLVRASVDEFQHRALFVRDAAGLSTSGGEWPPRLLGAIPENHVARAADHKLLMAAWSAWWGELTTMPLTSERLRSGAALPRETRLKRYMDALAGEFDAWYAPYADVDARLGQQLHPVARRAAAEAVEGGVMGTPEARISVLMVVGGWSRLTGPGVLLCSRAFYDDPVVLHEGLVATFRSGLK